MFVHKNTHLLFREHDIYIELFWNDLNKNHRLP